MYGQVRVETPRSSATSPRFSREMCPVTACSTSPQSQWRRS